MQIYSQLVPLALGNANGSAVAMGFFDGIHIGHRAVIEGAVQWARAHGASPAVFTFKLPTENKMKGKRLLSTEDKHALIERLGVEHYLCPDFEEIKAMTPEQFVLGIVRDCNAKAGSWNGSCICWLGMPESGIFRMLENLLSRINSFLRGRL